MLDVFIMKLQECNCVGPERAREGRRLYTVWAILPGCEPSCEQDTGDMDKIPHI